MIKYPFLEKGATIGVTAPSSGVNADLHHIMKESCDRLEQKGYKVIVGDTVWTQVKAKSAPAKRRADEFNEMMRCDDIDIIIPPWGGELLVEMIEYIDFNSVKEKWILGYSDISLLLLVITLKTGIATAHGTNLVDLRGEKWDETTTMWESVLSTKASGSIIQQSSAKYQKEWEFQNFSECVFNLTEDTNWKTINNEKIKIQGRLLGGCIDVIKYLIGTPFGEVDNFTKKYINGESIVWYLENCELSTTDLRRSLVQMKLAGWFDNCSGIMFGRSNENQSVEGYTVQDIYYELSDELQIPIIYDIDCGHMPPQVTLINGAYAEVEVENGRGIILQRFI